MKFSDLNNYTCKCFICEFRHREKGNEERKHNCIFSGHFLGYFCLPWENKVEIITAISATLTSLREKRRETLAQQQQRYM